jgi:hypothetical protein
MTRFLTCRPVLPRRRGRTDVDLGANRQLFSGADTGQPSLDLGRHGGPDRDPVELHPEVPEGFDHFERQWSGAEDGWAAVGRDRVVHRPGTEHVVDASVAEGQVDLDVVGLPLVGDRLDADAGDAERAAVVPDPGVDRLAHLRVVRLLREDELPLRVEAARQVDGHDVCPFVNRAT